MLIGLNGRIGAGKNTVAERLAVIHGNVVEVSFAAKLKQSVCALLGCTLADLEEWKNDPTVRVEVVCDDNVWVANDDAEAGQTIRSFLQRYGTESHRDVFGEDFWLDAALPMQRNGIRGRVAYDEALYVVTDMRFPNELQRVKDLGGVTVQVIGPDEHAGGHRSEIPLACDYGLNNAVRDDGYTSLDRNLRVLLDEFAVASIAA